MYFLYTIFFTQFCLRTIIKYDISSTIYCQELTLTQSDITKEFYYILIDVNNSLNFEYMSRIEYLYLTTEKSKRKGNSFSSLF